MNTSLHHIMFIHGGLRMGGIETFLVRVASVFKARGVDVTVLFMSHDSDPALLASLQAVAHVTYMDDICVPKWLYNERATLLNYFLPIDKTTAQALVNSVDHIHFTDCMTMVVALELCKRAGVTRKISGGVYHQHEYSFAGIHKAGFTKRLHFLLKEMVTVDNLIFYNEASMATVSKMVGSDCTTSALLPIGIDLLRCKPRKLNQLNSRKVVSVGRITRMKTYNFTFLDTLNELNKLGYCLDYHIYGDGECLSELRQKIHSFGLDSQVTLHGNLDYSRFHEVLEDALVFLGSGTALVEAAACGVPALIGIESQHNAITYGFLHDTTGFSYQEGGLDYPLQSFSQCCLFLLKANDTAYQQICDLSSRRAQDFSLEQFIDGFFDFHMTMSTPRAPKRVINRLSFIASLIMNKLITRGKEGSYWTRHNLGQLTVK